MLGILMLETRFPRIPGDIGNPATWPFPVRYRIVPGADPAGAVLRDARRLTTDFIEAGRELVQAGCTVITTSCGFLSVMQAQLAQALGVPVVTSALMLVPRLQSGLAPGQRVGVLTISSETLSAAHLRAVGIDPQSIALVGTDPHGAFSRTILEDRPEMDIAACRRDLLEAVDRLVLEGEIGAIVLECTNMAPHAELLADRSGCPVHSINTLILETCARSGIT